MHENHNNGDLLSFGEHLDVLRKMLFRIIAVVVILAILIFSFKTEVFEWLLGPSSSNFYTFKWIERALAASGLNFTVHKFQISLISTELSSQFMTHITISCLLGLLLSSPYIVFELFRFISPALYESEKRYSYLITGVVYALFLIGLAMSYFVIFPISVHFLSTYSVSESIQSTITLDSYMSTFITLTFMMGVVFQLPVIAFVLGKMGVIDSDLLSHYRGHALVIIMIVAAIITPPDIFTLILVTIPLYALYELSILVLKASSKKMINTA